MLKRLPRTNCGDCGLPTCMAFATQVIKEGEDLAKCPHLPPAAQELAGAISSQQEKGEGRRRESLAISLEVMHAKIAPLNFRDLADGLGAVYGEEDGRPYLTFSFFGQTLLVFKDEVRYPPGAAPNPWDAILLYNFIASCGKELPTGTWITYQSLPNSVSKAKTLARLEKELADHFAGNAGRLRRQAAALHSEPVQASENADFQGVFLPLPRVPILLLFWDAEPEEDFPAQAHILFDSTVSGFLDLESLLFLVEQLMDRLMQK
ncbi:MAG: DUF3786 domain-containing protein [Deltaproteobacteria bacterium]|nr:DUF3786 domain-containing protein [Deltaproteobacteria bacterium]